MDVLQRDVDISGHFGAFANGCNQLVSPMGRVGVEQAYPKITGQRGQLPKQAADSRSFCR